MSRLSLSLRLARGLVATAAVLALVQACGRSEPGDYLFGDDDGTSGSGVSGKTGTSGSGGAGVGGTRPGKGGSPSVGGKGIGGAPIAGTTGVGGTSIGGSGGSGGSGIAGAGGMVIGGAAGAAGEPNLPDVTCGTDKCDAATEVCCASVAGFGCISNKKACNGAVLDCTSADDCGGGDVCCLTFTAPTGSASTCKDRCVGMNTDIERQLCSTDDECVGNRRCTATIFGISVCTRRP